MTPDVIAKVTGGLPDPQVWEEAQRRLLDVTDLRLKAIVGSTGRAAGLTQSRSACMHRHGHAPQVGLELVDLDDYALPHLDEEVPLSPWAEALKPMSDIAEAA
jgi:hypothetical protein